MPRLPTPAHTPVAPIPELRGRCKLQAELICALSNLEPWGQIPIAPQAQMQRMGSASFHGARQHYPYQAALLPWDGPWAGGAPTLSQPRRRDPLMISVGDLPL